MKEQIKGFIDRLPYIRTIVKERDLYKTDYYPGHYHSSIVAVSEIRQREEQIFSIKGKDIAGITLHEEQQLALLQELAKNYDSIPFTDKKKQELRYFYDNAFYCQS